jgi:hypothetical protein
MLVLLAVPVDVVNCTITLPHTFVNGTPADSDDSRKPIVRHAAGSGWHSLAEFGGGQKNSNTNNVTIWTSTESLVNPMGTPIPA